MFSKDAAFIYCSTNKRLTQVLKVIDAIIEGLTETEIINHKIAPNLTIRTINHYYQKYSKLLNQEENK